MTHEETWQAALDFHRVYMNRCETFQDFHNHWDCAGRSLENGWLESNKQFCIVQDKDWNELGRYRLKDIWDAIKGDQPSLDLFSNPNHMADDVAVTTRYTEVGKKEGEEVSTEEEETLEAGKKKPEAGKIDKI